MRQRQHFDENHIRRIVRDEIAKWEERKQKEQEQKDEDEEQFHASIMDDVEGYHGQG